MHRRLIPLIVLILLTACTATEEPEPEVNPPDPPSIADNGEPKAISEPPTATAIPPEPAVTATPAPPTETAFPTLAASEAVTLVLSLESFCREGPGSEYPEVGAVAAGELVYVVGVSADSGYPWVVVLDNMAGETCWLWTEHATIEGDLSQLPEVPVPPLP
jgi:uncharacterized protein YgiM (DUF1202 family)